MAVEEPIGMAGKTGGKVFGEFFKIGPELIKQGPDLDDKGLGIYGLGAGIQMQGQYRSAIIA
jgi:hypothetical protein